MEVQPLGDKGSLHLNRNRRSGSWETACSARKKRHKSKVNL